MNVGCILLAAGLAERFGGDKLKKEFEGKTLIEWALQAIPRDVFYRVAVVAKDEEVMALAKEQGFIAVLNDHPEDGVSRSIALGMDQFSDADALMFMVADQPRLKESSVRDEVKYYLEDPSHIVAMGDGDRRGNPAIFPKEFFPALRKLHRDDGGSYVIGANEERLRLFQINDGRELFDVDSQKELDALRRM